MRVAPKHSSKGGLDVGCSRAQGHSKPQTQNSKPQKSDPKPAKADSKLITQNSKPKENGSKLQTPNSKLEFAIAARHSSQTELSNLRTLLAEKSARLTDLETTGDLRERSVLAKIGTLQILTTLLPRRIAAQEQQDNAAEKTLIDATNQFIREHLGPRIKQLSARTRKIVEAQLSPHVRDSAALIVAVAGSEHLRRLQSLDRSASLAPANGALTHATSALESWTAANEFENALPKTLHINETI